MKIESIDSKMPVKFCRLLIPKRVPEGLMFLSAAALFLWGPILLHCAITAQAEPLYVVAGTQALGALIGTLMYTRQSSACLSCVPENRIRDILRGAEAREDRKAA